VVREGLSVRACEDLVRSKAKQGVKLAKKGRAKALDPQQRSLVEDLQRRFGTKVDLHQGRRGGKLVIHYFSSGELERILEVIAGR